MQQPVTPARCPPSRAAAPGLHPNSNPADDLAKNDAQPVRQAEQNKPADGSSQRPEYFSQLASINEDVDALSCELAGTLSSYRTAMESAVVKSAVRRSLAQFVGFEVGLKQRRTLGTLLSFMQQDQGKGLESEEERGPHDSGKAESSSSYEAVDYRRKEPVSYPALQKSDH